MSGFPASLLQTAEACKKAGAPEVDVVSCDMTSSKAIDEMAKTLLERHQCMDVLVNSAGIFPMTGQTPLEGKFLACIHLGTSMQVNCRSVWHCVMQTWLVLFVCLNLCLLTSATDA